MKFLHLLINLSMVCSAMACQNADSNDTKKIENEAAGSLPQQQVGGPCETCELIDVGRPDSIDAVDTSLGWSTGTQKLQIEGRIIAADGKTPAANVVLYYWHTNSQGEYVPDSKVPNSNNRHGHLRGWVKTKADGRFTIFTNRPGSYPNSTNEAHIHVLIKEADIGNPYFIDEWVFDDDPLLTAAKRSRQQHFGGSGVQQVANKNGLQIIQPIIYLGKNIAGHPRRN